jgi:hypothetical protein
MCGNHTYRRAGEARQARLKNVCSRVVLRVQCVCSGAAFKAAWSVSRLVTVGHSVEVVRCAVKAVCSEFRLSNYTIKLTIDDSVEIADGACSSANLSTLYTNLVSALCTRV